MNYMSFELNGIVTVSPKKLRAFGHIVTMDGEIQTLTIEHECFPLLPKSTVILFSAALKGDGKTGLVTVDMDKDDGESLSSDEQVQALIKKFVRQVSSL